MFPWPKLFGSGQGRDPARNDWKSERAGREGWDFGKAEPAPMKGYCPGTASATGHLLQLLGVSIALHRDPGGGVIDLTQIVGREFDRNCPDVFVQAMQLRGA